MASLDQYLKPMATGAAVQKITDDLGASASAGGYAAWVYAVTGKPPAVQNLGGNRASLVLTEKQNLAMRKWLDRQLASALSPTGEKPKVEYNMGSYVIPWAIKYSIPAGVGLFVLGWIAAYYFQR